MLNVIAKAWVFGYLFYIHHYYKLSKKQGSHWGFMTAFV